MAFTTLISATTSASTATLSVTAPTTISADYLTGDEEIVVQVATIDGTDYKDLWSLDRRVILTAQNNTDILSASGDYKFIKNKTDNAVALGYQV